MSMGTAFVIETADERKFLMSRWNNLASPDGALVSHQSGSDSVFRHYLRSFAFICGSKQFLDRPERGVDPAFIQSPRTP